MVYPQTLSLNAGDKLLYTGACQLQVSIVLPDGTTQSVASVSPGSFAEAPVTTTYELKIVGATCCAPGGHTVYPADVGAAPVCPDPTALGVITDTSVLDNP